MLHNAGIQGPYILVGNSFGGLNVQLFAATYPDEVVGLVLADSSNEDTFEKVQKDSMNPLLGYVGLGVVYVGIPRFVQNFQAVKALTDKTIEKYDAKIQEIYYSQKMAVKHAAVNIQEAASMQDNCNALRAIGSSFGDLPLIVISADKPLVGPELKAVFAPGVMEKMNHGWKEVQAGLVSKSSQSKHVIAQNCGHVMAYDQPEIIVKAVREMIEVLK